MSETWDDIELFEKALRERAEGTYILKLFVSGSTPKSAKAVSNIRHICEVYLPGRYELEVIDVYQQPELAYESQLLAAPTLIREQPEPIRKVVGDMSNEERVLVSLNIERKQA